MSTADWVDRVLTKLAALDVLPAEDAANRNENEYQRNMREYYGLVLNPKATLKEIEEFERRHQIRLPDDYRAFVLEIGNGGCGPPEGLYSFQASDGPDHFSSLGSPFLLTEPPSKLDPLRPILFTQEIKQVRHNGLLLLSHYGCGTLACLVVCGMRFGEVWIDDSANSNLIYPTNDSWVVSRTKSDKGTSFGEWYEGWLDQQLEKWD